MGCAASVIDKDERVQNCKERKRLMKRLLGFRREFSDSLLAYLRALKNIGVTLRQFTESELIDLENVPFCSVFPPSPPPPLPPSPPPPPFSPDKVEGNLNVGSAKEEIIEIDEDNNGTPPPPAISSSSWDFWEPFDSTSPQHEKLGEVMEQVEEEDWAETRTEFDEDDNEVMTSNKAATVLPNKVQSVDMMDDNSSMMSGQTKDTADMAMVVRRCKKSLPGIVKELDDYFLKASAGGKGIAVIVDIDMRNTSQHYDSRETMRKGNNSGKVFSSFPWSWSSRSLLSTRNAAEFGSLDEPCKPGAHCITLAKLYAEEQRLYKAVMEEETAKLELRRKSLMLQKQENENADWNRIEKTRVAIENLESDILRLQEFISQSSSSILALIDKELHPQFVALVSGLMHMWRTMFQCHQVQHHISQQLNHLSSHHSTDLTTGEYHCEATVQLESEVSFWYNSLCRLAKSQREYVRALFRWIQLTDSLLVDVRQNDCASAIRAVCEEWKLAVDRLSEKVALEAIKRFLSVIHSMISQQQEECSLKKKSDKMEKRLLKKLNSLRKWR
ncbi:hypothetical protein Nepgr_003274 [Nepenthes gracilis]|uniref:Nitrate regulatory gene2 protein n=1 Tax=Nepenthes gracilis TaxID=150966 RepID=A0AAD3RZ97_NEPGR|nr:hypothetical protein Nepgr_003274 [Nepenthes gracilis]